MIQTPFSGVYPPLVLPLDERKQIDFESLGEQIKFLIQGGVHGIWINGTSGDFFHLNDEERQAVIRHSHEVAGDRLCIISQVGDTSSRLAVGHTERALQAGAECLAVCFPYYLEYTEEELKSHFRTVKQSAGETPVFLYQLPQITKVKLSVRGILELAAEGTIAGVKESSGDLAYFRNLCDLADAENSPLRIFMGVGLLADLGMYFGGHGIMAAIANLAPAQVRRMYDAFSKGDIKTGSQLQRSLNDLCRATALAPRNPLYWAPTTALYKYLLKELGVIRTAEVFEPVRPLDDEEVERLHKKALPLIESMA